MFQESNHKQIAAVDIVDDEEIDVVYLDCPVVKIRIEVIEKSCYVIMNFLFYVIIIPNVIIYSL